MPPIPDPSPHREHSVVTAFRERFGAEPAHLARAPGRVNLIGEHTDYNDGFVMPMALEHAVLLAFRPRSDRRVELHSLDEPGATAFGLGAFERGEGWGEYVKGVAWALQEAGCILRGFEGVLASSVPRGAGLSSSAALELAVARAFATASGLRWDPRSMALLGQRAENGWVGVSCGVMDQMASACGVAGHALLVDCRSLAATPVPMPPSTAVVVLDTGTRRALVSSAYNTRRAECEAAADHFGAAALRDVTLEQVEAARNELPDVLYRRTRHVVTENARVLEAAEAMRAGDAPRLGALMAASHESLRGDYEVSSAALDAFVDEAAQHGACYGARMTGAGFGGCAIALVEEERAGAFAEAVTGAYALRTGNLPKAFVGKASDGATVKAPPGQQEISKMI